MSTVLLVFMALFGLAIGSFLNVVIVRIPSDESLLRPPSKCPMCESPIANRDNIPVISWILLKGRCRSCGEPIPAGYPLVEATNCLLWILAALRFDEPLLAVAYALFFSVLLALSVIDFELYILPNKITYPAILVSLAVMPALSFVYADNPADAIKSSYAGGIAYAGFLLVTLLVWEFVTRKEGMGMGDVKLAVVLGLWLGWLNVFLPLYALVASSVLGLVAGVVMLIVRRESRAFPFGPWLALGTVIVILASGWILTSQSLYEVFPGA